MLIRLKCGAMFPLKVTTCRRLLPHVDGSPVLGVLWVDMNSYIPWVLLLFGWQYLPAYQENIGPPKFLYGSLLTCHTLGPGLHGRAMKRSKMTSPGGIYGGSPFRSVERAPLSCWLPTR